MRTLIVPCAGSRNIAGVPLFLNRHPDGRLLVIKAIQEIFPENYDRIIVTVLKKDYEEFDVKGKIEEANAGKYPIEFVRLLEKTSGPAETIYKTIELADISGEFAVRDSHNYIALKEDITGNFLTGLNLTKYERPIENLRSKNFITLNEQGQVLDVVEKHFCADVISTGFYGFKSADDFCLAFQRLNDPDYSFAGIYISHIISYLIGYQQRIFRAEMVTEFEDWSTKTAWHRVQKFHATFFLDLDQLCGTDGCMSERTMQNLQKLSRQGAKFIGFTATITAIDRLENYLREKQIAVLNIIGGCTHSPIRMLVGSETELNELLLEV